MANPELGYYSETGEWNPGAWAESCSICFTNPCDIALPGDDCGDQLCASCLTKYLHSKIQESSWGVRASLIGCPVCFAPIQPDIIDQFVDDEHKALLGKFEARRAAPMARPCPAQGCSADITLSIGPSGPAASGDARDAAQSALARLARAMGMSSAAIAAVKAAGVELAVGLESTTAQHSQQEAQEQEQQLQQEQQPLSPAELDSRADAFFSSIEAVLASLTPHREPALRSEFLARVVGLAPSPELRRALELRLLVTAPDVVCASCDVSACFLCGELSHSGMSCEEAMLAAAAVLDTAAGAELDPDVRNVLLTRRWVASNSKRCPHCASLVQRDDGCNKMSCTVCFGAPWCWFCRGTSSECSFYTCAIAGPNQPDSPPQDALASAPAELGVPDVLDDSFGDYASTLGASTPSAPAPTPVAPHADPADPVAHPAVTLAHAADVADPAGASTASTASSL